jgi:hypothetical protein
MLPAEILGLAMLYFGCGKLGLSLAFLNASASAVLPHKCGSEEFSRAHLPFISKKSCKSFRLLALSSGFRLKVGFKTEGT